MRDMALLERTLGERFTLTTGRPGAEVRTREEWLAITEGRYVVQSSTLEELQVEPYGDAAVVHMRLNQVGRMDGHDRTGSFRMTDVWIRSERRWRLVARHSTALA